jgi:hypothetical protein
MALSVSVFRERQARERKGMHSWYERIAPQLDEQRRAELDEALADRDIYPRVIALVLEDWGYSVTASQVSWHRRTRGL